MFSLRGIADRIEREPDGRYVILDYKTGAVRSEKQVRTGLAPQLTLEAAMLRKGGFAGHSGRHIGREIAYVMLKGGEPPGEYKPIRFKDGTPDSQADRALERLDQACPDASMTRPNLTARSCIRCGGRVTAITTISRASRNGRATGGEIDDIQRGRRMRTPDTIPEDVRRGQSAAADPKVSAWLAANAGSGKTHVLAQRVINLMLEDVEPEKILCITFTKAAAANMAKRVFDTLADWTTLDDATLDNAIHDRSN